MRKGVLLLTLLCLTLSPAEKVLAYHAEGWAESRLTTGNVDIRLEEMSYDTDKENVSPGQCLPKILRITNLGNSCYLRAKVSFQSVYPMGMDCLGGIAEGWRQIGDTLYSEKPVEQGTIVELFQTLTIPSDWDNKVLENGKKNLNGSEVALHVTVDALQSRNFSPDFEKDRPWGDTEAEKCRLDGQYELNVFRNRQEVTVKAVMEGESSITVIPTDFFSGLGTLLPGDTAEESVEILNKENLPAELFFRTEAVKDQELLQKAEFHVSLIKDGKRREIYNGNLMEGIAVRESLGMYAPGERGELCFTISLPKELTNEFSLREAQSVWHFEADAKEVTKERKTVMAAKTGDFMKTRTYASLIVVSVIIILEIYRRKRNG